MTGPGAIGGAGRTDVDAAVRGLRDVRSHDPCAALAMATIKATIHTLETHWCSPPPPDARAESVDDR